jgi:hypothetical protein
LLAALLLCAFIWVRGYFRDDGVAFAARKSGHYRRWACDNIYGVLTISYEHQNPNSRIIYTGPNGWEFDSVQVTGSPDWAAGGQEWHGIPIGYSEEFAYAALLSGATPGFGDHMDHDDVTRSVWFPLWMPTLVLTWLILGLFLRSRRRAPPGFCKKCGYDLRATPDRCPECGTLTSRA